MADNHHTCFNVVDRSYLALIKKDIHNLALEKQFEAQRLAEVDIVVAELTSNLIKYSREGQLLVKTLSDGEKSCIEIISLDKGPGMSDVGRMMEDGVSTSKTLGHGLGAIKRLADEFEIYTVKGWGTILVVRIWTKASNRTRKYTAEVKSVLVPKPGETVCGDAFGIKQTPQRLSLFLGDGLGHGHEAAKAALAAVAAFHECTATTPSDTLRFIHQAVRKTRGLVGTAAFFDYQLQKWSICGVGNILCRIGTPDHSKNYLPYNGILGMNIPSSLNDQEIMYTPDQLMILCSDGIKSKLELYRNQGIYKQDLSVLATALYKDFARQTDDMSVVVGKLNI
ncbi:Anti-sigma regulatory factor (Ser/Thr protein kinase) [Filimonas lacunae]|uniref:Anti-sigma regulatory factor (Ser/Thr protein kinase) n=1 Tax=Filimonas lacunae TaxID=477680 RepID=A0A173MLN7_9BACT|nr:ATP-binding SpoIIE family protein phosphatase [Filimonas lacunae]BAV08552.1 anti-sigma B factor RsbT [Filimonas lacunae]SIS56946.1 Anti-sigma regulatory factor (Ser/Thr protein kinase) [Filimonas lacunae]